MNNTNNTTTNDPTELKQALLVLIGEALRIPILLEQVRVGQDAITAKLDALIEGQTQVGDTQKDMGRTLEALFKRQDLLEDASRQRTKLTDEHFDLHVLDPMARQIISIYDMARESVHTDNSPLLITKSGVMDGIQTLLLSLLESYGIELIAANPGDKFDASHMRPVMTCDTHDAALDGTVQELMRPGFRRGVRVLRIAQVIVYRLSNKIERTDEPDKIQDEEQ